jgi:DNA-binding NarL/FixJ family response regulator
VTTYLEAWKPSGPELVPLEGDRVTIGKGSGNDVVLTGDGTVSRMHAALERFGAGWCLRDLGSRNGTLVNGERVLRDRALRAGDEIQIGRTRLVFRGEHADASVTEVADAPPALTPRERDILIALCRPVLSGNLLTEPASVRAIAAEVFLTDSAVKKHLVRLYDKFNLHDDDGRRRGRLANEAIKRRAVTLGDLRG